MCPEYQNMEENLFNEELWSEEDCVEDNEPKYVFAGKKRANLKELYEDLGWWYADMF